MGTGTHDSRPPDALYCAKLDGSPDAQGEIQRHPAGLQLLEQMMMNPLDLVNLSALGR
jgi:hypothetical protein